VSMMPLSLYRELQL